MIISHRHKFIFAAIPKTGTHSVRRVLREHMGDNDHEQVGLFVQKRLPFPALAELGHGHIGLNEVRPYVGDDQFNAYLKFAFVRNPFDRFVSYCAFMTRDDGAFLRNPREIMRYFLFKDRPDDHLLFVPQHTFICDEGGRLQADVVGRVEGMQSSFNSICDQIGLPHAILDKVNSSEHGTFREYYDQELIEGVADYYGRDLELFGYRFEETGP